MGRIRTFEAPALNLQPSEVGINAQAQAARRIGAEFNEVADATSRVGHETARNVDETIQSVGKVALDYETHRELSAGAAAFAQLQDNLTNQWNDTAKKADPNDPAVAAKFRESVLEPALEKYREAFNTEGGQDWADRHIGSLRLGMFEKTAADMGTLAAQAAAVNVHKTSNSLSNTAMTNPESVPRLLTQADSIVEGLVGSSPNLKGAVAAKARMELTQRMKEEVVKSGAIGAIQKSPNPEAEAEKWGQQYPDYISGADLKVLAGNARQQIRADRTDQAYRNHLLKLDAEAKSDAAEGDILKKLYSDDPKMMSEVSTKSVVNDPTLTRTAKERLVNIVNREMKPETAAVESNRNYLDVLNDIRSGKIDSVEPIYKARIDGKINRADFNQAMKDFSEFKSPEGEALSRDRTTFFKQYAGSIAGTTYDPVLGSPKMYAAEKEARRQESVLRAKGLDPHLVYDPRSEYFFGRPANLTRFQTTMQEQLNAPAREPDKAPAALPDIKTREAGQTYNTPRGPMKWTGTGWVKP